MPAPFVLFAASHLTEVARHLSRRLKGLTPPKKEPGHSRGGGKRFERNEPKNSYVQRRMEGRDFRRG